MDNLDRVVILFALGAAVVAIVMVHGRKPVVGHPNEKIPDDRINKSARRDYGLLPGPSYLLSNLPSHRCNDDYVPLASDGAVLVSADGANG